MKKRIGHSFEDREISGAARNKGIAALIEALDETPASKKWGVYKKQLLLKLAPTLLPRINKHEGNEGGEPIIFKWEQ